MRVIDYFDRGAGMDRSRACLVAGEVSKSYGEVQQRTHQIAKALIRDGFTPRDIAAVISPNHLVAFECVLGILRSEAVWVPINIRNAAGENAYILDDFEVGVLFYHSEAQCQVELFRTQCPRIRQFVCIDRDGGPDAFLETWISGYDGPAVERGSGRDDLASISPTGGTTGRPKGAMWSNLTWQTMIGNNLSSFPSRKPPVHLVAAPMTHAAGVMGIVLMASGATNVILPGFDGNAIIDAIGRHKVTHLFLPPTAIYMLLGHPNVRAGDYSSLEYFTYSAAPMSVEKLREAIAVFGPVMTTAFGQVEAPATCTYMTPWELVVDGVVQENRIASCGRTQLHSRVAIMDEQGNLLPPGERGEIVVRGNLVMLGYYKNPKATAEISRFGWHHTGDIGFMDEHGFFFVVDRKKDMIITGGFNVYSTEVEQAIWGHPAVRDCVAIGVPDDKWGEAIKAIVELKPGASAAEDEIIAYAKNRVGSIKAPKSVEFWPQLPRTAAGKVSKKDVRARYWAETGRRI